MKNQTNTLDKIICIVFFIVAAMLVPLYLQNGYFNFIEAKGLVYIYGSAIVLVMILINCIYKRSFAFFLPGKNVTDRIIILFGIVILVSVLLSGNIGASMFGTQGWMAGGYLFLSLILIFSYLSKQQIKISQIIWMIVIVINIFIFIVCILHALDVDVFSVHKLISKSEIYMYMSTLGQKNWVSGYLCIMIPLFVFFSLDAKETFSKVLYAVVLVTGVFSVVLCSSDSVFVGLGLAFAAGLPFIMKKTGRIQRVLGLTIIFEIEVILVKYLPAFENKRDNMGGMFHKLISHEWIFCFLAVSVILLICTFFAKKFIEDKHVLITIILEIILGIVVAYFIIHSIVNFNEHWGTNRGRTWIYSMNLFGSFSLKEKLIGIGPDMLSSVYDSLSETFNQSIKAAHNEFLQFLLTTGIAGAALWVLGWVSIIVEFIRKKIYKKENVIYFVPLAAYLGQSFLNSPMVLNVPLVWLVFLCYRLSFNNEVSAKN